MYYYNFVCQNFVVITLSPKLISSPKLSFRRTHPRVHEDKVHLGEREDDLQNIGIKIHFLSIFCLKTNVEFNSVSSIYLLLLLFYCWADKRWFLKITWSTGFTPRTACKYQFVRRCGQNMALTFSSASSWKCLYFFFLVKVVKPIWEYVVLFRDRLNHMRAA